MSWFNPVYLVFFSVLQMSVCTPWGGGNEPEVKNIKLPEGFKISFYHKNVPQCRSLCVGAEGTVFAGSRGKGIVYALPDKNNDHLADTVLILASGLNYPNGVAFKDGDLYVAEISRILKYANVESNLNSKIEPIVVYDKLPPEVHHGWKYIAFGPDEKLYVPVGAPCNICESEDPVYASMLRMNSDGSNMEIYASGIRNTVGFDWHPNTNKLFFTDNGRDMLGDDMPPDELNKINFRGEHFGYPYCHGGNISDPKFGDKKPCGDFTSPVQNLKPHVAALGIKFYSGNMFPEAYRSKAFICEHGSWNSSVPVGYKISTVDVDEEGKVSNYKDFATGWLKGKTKTSGRPVAMAQLNDGSLLISDDHAGCIYRLTYEN